MSGAWWSTASSSTQTSPTTRTTWVNAPFIKFLQKKHFRYTFYHCATLRKKDCTKIKLTSSPAETASTCSSQARPSLSPSSIHRWLAGAKVCLGFIKEGNLISGEPNFWFGSKNITFILFPQMCRHWLGSDCSQWNTRAKTSPGHRIVPNPKAFWSCVF